MNLRSLVVCLAVVSPIFAQSWYSPSWSYRKTITIDRARVQASSPLTDFPVLISRASDPDPAARALSNANDIVFTASDGVTKLSHQIETYVPSTSNWYAALAPYLQEATAAAR